MEKIRPFSPKMLIRHYLNEGIGFLAAGLFAFAALWITPAIQYDLFICILLSGLYLSVAANALAEEPAEREIINLNRVTSHFIGLAFPGAILFLCLLPILAIPGWFARDQQLFTAALSAGVILTSVLVVGSRLWPAYVTPWLFRGWDQVDLWRSTSRCNPMVTDWPIAWRLTGMWGSFRRAYVPVLGALIVGAGVWGSVMFCPEERHLVSLLLNLILLVVLVPVFVLTVLDRAKALRDAKAASERTRPEPSRQAHQRRPEPAPSKVPKDEALRDACMLGDGNRVRELLRAGADPNHWTAANQPLLMDCVSAASLDILEDLLHFGANINRPDGSGRTALHVAGISQRIPVIKLLLKQGANVSLMDKKGKTAFDDAAAFGGNPAVLELLAGSTADKRHPREVLALFSVHAR